MDEMYTSLDDIVKFVPPKRPSGCNNCTSVVVYGSKKCEKYSLVQKLKKKWKEWVRAQSPLRNECNMFWSFIWDHSMYKRYIHNSNVEKFDGPKGGFFYREHECNLPLGSSSIHVYRSNKIYPWITPVNWILIGRASEDTNEELTRFIMKAALSHYFPKEPPYFPREPPENLVNEQMLKIKKAIDDGYFPEGTFICLDGKDTIRIPFRFLRA